MSNMAQGRDLSDPRTAETLGGDRADDGAAAAAARADRLRYPRRRPRRLERLEGAVAAQPLLGDRGGARRRPFRDRSQVARRAPQEALRKALPNWSDPDFEAYASRHYPAYWLKVDLARQVAHAKLLYAMAAEVRSLTTEVSTDAVPRRHRDHRRRARPSAPAFDYRRGVRSARRQYRRRAYFHHHRRLRARFDLHFARLRAQTTTRCAAAGASRERSSRRCAARSGCANFIRTGRNATRARHLRDRAGGRNRQYAVRTATLCCRSPRLDRLGLLYDLTSRCRSSISTSARPISSLSARRRSTRSM